MPDRPASVGKTLLVGWDGADWAFLRPFCERGLMPVLTSLARNGVAGELQSLPPYLSPMLWSSIATGKRPWQHGIHGFTKVDEKGKVHPVSSRDRKVPAIWNMLSAEGLKTHVVGWFASHPAEAINGVSVSEAYFQPASTFPVVSPATIPPGAVFPKAMEADLADLVLKPNDLAPEILHLLIPEVTQSMLENDPRVGRLVTRLTELYSVHNVTASLLETEAWDFVAVYFHFLDWVLHDFAAFMPPKGPDISSAAFRRFSGVVEGACRLQDTLLAELLNLAGRDTRVFLVSDHGFLTEGDTASSPGVPTGIAAQHRSQGIFVASGPGLRRGERIQGASLLDITPTILRSFGLPVGADMDGKVLEEIFESPDNPDPTSIPSWDVRAAAPFEPKAAETEAPNLIERFIQLGYVDPQVVHNRHAAERERVANGWNLGMDLLDAHRPQEALPYLEEAHWSRPEMAHYIFWLARGQAACGLLDEAWVTAGLLDDFDDTLPALHRCKGIIALEANRPGEALVCFNRALAQPGPPGDLPTLRALALGQSGQWLDALEILQEEVVRNPTPETWLAIVKCYLWAQRPEGAIAAARQLLLLHPYRAQSHFLLAQGLDAGGKKEPAWEALVTAQRLRPNLPGLRSWAEKTFPEQVKEAELWGATSGSDLLPPEILRRESRARHAAWEKKREAVRRNEKLIFETGRPEQPGSSGQSFVIVSGLPRSGTSMLMQMLRRGGLEPMTDQQRAPDDHNPEGFFEWEPIRRLPADPALIESCAGKAVKVVSGLVPFLPHRHTYFVLAVVRSPGEIARSQSRMLGNVASDMAAMTTELNRHQDEWLTFLRGATAYIRVLELDYRSMIEDPSAASQAIGQFLGPVRLPHAERMAEAVRPELYRQREPEPNS